ncbi:hybrid sensor histidine kinase/response regulator [Aromatoleum buckelii]|uniref:histidine kinase n=1 Tax=Aromatoleum buckelii TaxID=200254 RepID=A0ABX1N5Q7_9RHOO|nr:PAS domain-containing protein [Aromatoleum buckelii]MCK0510990.1 PAS domain-containing protein [Aromatoleum buckelii]
MTESRPATVGVGLGVFGDVKCADNRRRATNGFVVAVAAVAIASAGRWLLDPWLGGNLPFFTFYFALLVAAWYGGLKPGLTAVVLGLAIGIYFFAPPRLAWPVDSIINRFDALRFALIGVCLAGICESLHRYRRRAEQREDVLRVTLASVGDGVITTDPEGQVRYLNPVAEALTGWRVAEARGAALETVFRIVREDTREPVENPCARALLDGTIVGLANHTLLITRDGAERPIDDSASPIRDRHGRVFGCVLIFRDVSSRRNTETALRRRETELRERHDELQNIYDTNPAGMALLDRDLRFVRINRRLAEMNGLPAEAHIGRTVREVVPSAADKVEPGLRRVLQTGEPLTGVELTCETSARPGVERTWLESWHPLRGANGVLAGINIVAVEITDRKRDELRIYELMTELKDADRRKDEFLATLAHELRGPLAPLSNMIGAMKLAEGDPELLRQARETMERQLAQMVRLVDDLLDVARITRDKLELRMARVELASVMYQAAETSRPLAQALRHEIVVRPPSEPIYLHADPVRLTQVFSNLLNNACKYTEPDGRVTISAERDGNDALVTVHDTGIGIPADKLESVFEMFSQVDHALDRSQGGLGIGLMLVKRLVELHGGTVRAASEGAGKGSEFTVRLPILVGELPPPPEARGAPSPALPRRVLIVDDNADSAQSLATLLGISGHAAHVALDGLDALRLAEALRPDVILLDIGLPGLNGYEVCRRMREQPWGKDILVVAMTGWGQDEDRRRSRDSGFDHHLVKPIDYAELAQLLADTGSVITS